MVTQLAVCRLLTFQRYAHNQIRDNTYCHIAEKLWQIGHRIIQSLRRVDWHV